MEKLLWWLPKNQCLGDCDSGTIAELRNDLALSIASTASTGHLNLTSTFLTSLGFPLNLTSTFLSNFPHHFFQCFSSMLFLAALPLEVDPVQQLSLNRPSRGDVASTADSPRENAPGERCFCEHLTALPSCACHFLKTIYIYLLFSQKYMQKSKNLLFQRSLSTLPCLPRWEC